MRWKGLPLTRAEEWTLHVSNLLVGGTGLVYAWLAYFGKAIDPYAMVNHPWQPAVQHLHVLAAPLLVFGTGLIWRRHIWSSWRLGVRPHRRSGVGMMLTLMPMVVSGYLIQTAVDSTWRKTWVIVHLTASVLWSVGYFLHQVLLLWRRYRPAGDLHRGGSANWISARREQRR